MKQLTTLQLLTASAIWSSALKSAKRLVGLLVRSAPLIAGSSSVSWVKAAFHFSDFVHRFISHQGHRGLAIYLKSASVMLMRSAAGHGLANSREIGGAVARNRQGLPRIIPAGMRKRIREGDKAVIRLYLGFFTLYRVLNYRGTLKLSTITSPGVPLSGGFIEEWKGFIKIFFTYLGRFGVKRARTDLVPIAPYGRASTVPVKIHVNPFGIKGVDTSSVSSDRIPRGCREEIWGYVPKLFPLMKSGPNSKKGRVNSGNIVYDFLAWIQRPQLFKVFQVMVAVTRSWALFPSVMADTLSYLTSKHPVLMTPFHGAFHLGALSVKEEPGKLRVFAMVDSLTQWLLYPLHKMIFDQVLRKIPQDGTFDQIAPVKKLISLVKEGRDHRIWSFDLTAATDRIPVILQEIVLGRFMTDEFASSWRQLLCDRDYRAPSQLIKQEGWLRSEKGEALGRNLRYAVGQPMGAYSSWAMLALVHHAMVQYAAWKAGCRGWFERYAVLGDDMVIADHYVAKEYLALCSKIGVGVNMSKSIVSNNLSLEFAKRFFYRGEEVTPLPLLSLAIGWLGVRHIAEIAKQVSDRTSRSPSLYSIGRYVNLGLRASSRLSHGLIFSMGRKAKSIALLLTRPNAVYGVSDLLRWYTLTRVSGSWLATEGAWESIADAVLFRISHFQALNLRRRLYRALVGFDISRCYNTIFTDRMAWFGVAEWWHNAVIEPYKAPILRRLDEVDNMISSVSQVLAEKDHEKLVVLLQAMEDLEEQVALIPSEVRFARSEQEAVRTPSDKFPKRVRGWTKLIRKFRRASQDASHR